MRSPVAVLYGLILAGVVHSGLGAQEALKTPLPDETLRLLANTC